MRLSLIVAVSENRVIGKQGDLPWRLSTDLKRFKRLTMGHHLIMGRKTFESIGRLLPGRTSLVLTRDAHFRAEGARVVHSLEAALQAAAGDVEAFVIGGAEIYALALPRVNRIYLTKVQAVMDGDAFFPELAEKNWQIASSEDFPADARNDYPHRFLVLDRKHT